MSKSSIDPPAANPTSEMGARQPPPGALPRVLGPFDAVALVVGSIIGSGIFLKVDKIANYMQAFGPIIAVWLVGGVAALCGSLALAELAAMFPRAGGPYVYLREAYGRWTAFLWGWAEFAIIRTGSLGSLACGAVIYFNRFLESLEARGVLPAPLAEITPLSHFGQALLTVFAVASLCAVNVIGVRWSARMQNVTTLIKVSFLAFLIAGPWLFAKVNFGNLAPVQPASLGLEFWKMFGLAMIAVFWPYDGWVNIAPVAEEIKSPQRNVPLALCVGLLIVIAVYVGANCSYHLMMPMASVQKTRTVAADVMGQLIGPWGVTIAALGVMISMFGALNSNLLAGPRIYFAMARDRLFPAFIRRVHPRFQTPANAIVVQGVWSLAQIAIVFGGVDDDPKNAFDTLTDFVILGGVLFYGLTVGAVFVLRFSRPDAERPYRTWGYPFTPLIYVLAAAAVVVSAAISSIGKVITVSVLLAAGSLIYVWFRKIEIRSGDPPADGGETRLHD